MSSRSRPRGPATVPAWVLRGNDVIDSLLLLLLVSILWWALTLLGLVVLGGIPASCGAGEVFRARRGNRRAAVVSTMWATFRRELVTVNLRGLPFHAVQVGALVSIFLALTGRVPTAWMTFPVAAVAAMALGWSTASLGALVSVPRLRRQDVPVAWRVALLCPGAVPFASGSLIAALALWTLACLFLPPLAVLLGPGVAVLTADVLLGRRVGTLLDSVAARDESPHSDSSHDPRFPR